MAFRITRAWTAAALATASMAVFLPAILLPILTVTLQIDDLANGIFDNLEAQAPPEERNQIRLARLLGGNLLSGLPEDAARFETTQSVLSAVRELYDGGKPVPASLILGFSVIVPVIKFTLNLALAVRAGAGGPATGRTWLQAVHKWALLDVFVVAVAVFALSAFDFFVVVIEPAFYMFLCYYALAFAALAVLPVTADRASPVIGS
ncbi:MAG: paraquat-inducible protein A [Maricaulaceae bacterium]